MRVVILYLVFVFGGCGLKADDRSSLESETFDANRLRRLLLDPASQKIYWDSSKHFHRFPGVALQIETNTWLSLIDERPGDFLRVIGQLSDAEKRQLTQEDLFRRNDWLDIFSVALKEEVQARWLPKFEQFPFNRSQLWSLAKSRLRALYSQNFSEAGFELSLFRKSDPESLDFVAACVGDVPNLLGPWKSGDQISFADIHFVEFKWDRDGEAFQNETGDLKCGAKRFRVSALSLRDWPSPIPESVPWIPRDENSDRLTVFSTIGLTNQVSSTMLNATQFYLRWFRGYKLISEEEVQLLEALAEGLNSADLFLPAIIVADANNFRFGLSSARALKLVFEKLVSDKKVRLEILLPPLEDQPGDKQFVLNQSEMAELLKGRETLPVIMDMACFSQKYVLDWLAVFSLSRRLRDSTATEFQSPSIVASSLGHPGESSFQIILIMDQVLGAVDRFAQNESWENVRGTLDGSSGLTRYWNFFSRLWQSRSDWESSSFKPVVLGTPPLDRIQNFKNWSSIQVDGGGDRERIYLPQLLSSSN